VHGAVARGCLPCLWDAFLSRRTHAADRYAHAYAPVCCSSGGHRPARLAIRSVRCAGGGAAGEHVLIATYAPAPLGPADCGVAARGDAVCAGSVGNVARC
jgi:hypothetical protein